MNNSFWLFDTFLTIIDEEKNTNRRYDLIEGVIPPGIETPLHIHGRYAESIYVLEGECTVYMEKGTFVLKPGDHIFIPLGAPHAVASSGKTAARALTVASPSGFADLIRNVGQPGELHGLRPDAADDLQAFMRYSDKIGDVILGPPGSRPAKQAAFPVNGTPV
ncbi:cupin domain-containing protein [Chitinophaga agrisoli]|uniref:cupin domain-containing protein n=1 Tax=Chitinophaga agrisoli TaxID=2607653 RepID=UPI00166217D5|nr:cupin domain-containing protein [Chitinophaga agrisoli]